MKKYCLFIILFIVSKAANSQVNTQSVAQSFSKYLGVTASGGLNGTLPAFNVKEETEGSPYFFTNWARGKVYMENNSILDEPAYILNFDKQNNQLIVKTSEKNILHVDMKDIKRFDLDDNLQARHFIRLPGSQSGYFITLYEDTLYSLYKTVTTNFFKADYENKGLYEKGYKYDRYVDENKYYIRQKNGNSYTVEAITKRDLKKLSDQIPAVKDFLTKNTSTSDPEKWLIDLTVYLNLPMRH